jgi:transposase
MTQHDFNTIFEHYPELISEMRDPFTSHEFILHLARRYQALYIEALYAYRDIPNPQHATPFKTVHRILAKHLNAFSQLVTNFGQVESIDIFTQENSCAQWQKV